MSRWEKDLDVLLQWQEASLQNYGSFQKQFTIQTSVNDGYSNVEELTQAIHKSPEINMVQIWQLGQILFDICGNN